MKIIEGMGSKDFSGKIKDRLKAAGLAMNSPELVGWAELHKGDYEAYSKLRKQGQRFDWVDARGRHPIHIAALGGNTGILRDLLDNCGQAINAETLDGETPILFAVSSSQIEAVRFLRDWGADLDVKPQWATGFHARVRAHGLQL